MTSIKGNQDIGQAIKTKWVKLSFEGISAVAENVSIPPNSEVLTMGDVMSSVSEEIHVHVPSVGIKETTD